ncbi:Hypothetical predicted protein [Pelobates cultripes]|uniref:Uncharacterized protein n=1 Tax=Pelobates cultripes TaxID=61616 RepID=A0AAD1TIH9_PELCU|nr:Hypothetical predicted protein [Pelobates cultripes]
MAIIALEVRNLIANQWKQPHCPSKPSKIQQYYTYERMYTKTAAQRGCLQSSWAPWVEYSDKQLYQNPPFNRHNTPEGSLSPNPDTSGEHLAGTH